MTHKAVNNTAPEYLCDLIRLNVKSTTIRTRASLILVYYVFPQLVKRVLIHSLIDLLCMLLQHCGMPFDTFKKSVKTHLYLKYFVN